MIKYIITIIDLRTERAICIERDADTIESCVANDLGGWANLRGASTGDVRIDDTNYQRCGTTLDKRFMFSILSFVPTIE